MSHAQIWDDSALVDSWNEALEEYKHYHSIAARGEKVEDVLRRDKNESNGFGGAADYEDEKVDDQLADDPHAKKNLPTEMVDHGTTSHGTNPRVGGEQRAVTDQTPARSTSRGPEIPQLLVGQVQDEGLKNLLMAWYYAGYYTGLMEGKQQGTAGNDEPTNK